MEAAASPRTSPVIDLLNQAPPKARFGVQPFSNAAAQRCTRAWRVVEVHGKWTPPNHRREDLTEIES